MKHRFLIHELNHTFLLVDITGIGLPNEIYPPEGKQQSVQSLRFQAWHDVERYFRSLGSSQEALDRMSADLKMAQVAVLTIV
jgi:hypothetical protein